MKIIEKLWPKIRHRLPALGILLLTVLLIWGAFGQPFDGSSLAIGLIMVVLFNYLSNKYTEDGGLW